MTTTTAPAPAPAQDDTLTNTEWLKTVALGTDEVVQEAYNKLLDLVNNEGYPLDDIRDFIEEYGYKAFVAGYYETWSELTDNSYSMEAIEAFVEEFGIENIDSFEDAYCGPYSGEEYARELVESGWDMNSIPGFVEIDWAATWANLDGMDYVEVDGHIFNNHF